MRKIMILFILSVMVMGVSLTVNAREQFGEGNSREEYQIGEKAYKEQVRELLKEYGIRNPGIMLVYVADQEGRREYTLSIHHRKLSNLEEKDTAMLQMRMKEHHKLLPGTKIRWELNQ